MAVYQLSNLVGKNVQLDRGGPESRVGLVLAVGDDFLVLSTINEGVIYYYVDHIKSITLVKNESSPDAIKYVLGMNYVNSGSMKDVFESNKYNQIQINRGGPESVKGVLTEIYDDYITIVLKEEVLLILYAHIKSCSFLNPNLVETNTHENSQANKQDNKNNGEEKNVNKRENKSKNTTKKNNNTRFRYANNKSRR